MLIHPHSVLRSWDIVLPPVAPPPEQLASPSTAAAPQANKLCHVDWGLGDNSVNEGRGGPLTFRIHGRLYHRFSSLLPRHGARPTYPQLRPMQWDTRLGQSSRDACRTDHVVYHIQHAVMYFVVYLSLLHFRSCICPWQWSGESALTGIRFSR